MKSGKDMKPAPVATGSAHAGVFVDRFSAVVMPGYLVLTFFGVGQRDPETRPELVPVFTGVLKPGDVVRLRDQLSEAISAQQALAADATRNN